MATAPAQAATLTCPSNIADNVTGTSSCEYSDTATQDFLETDPITVNAEGFFGFEDWSFVGKIGDDPEGEFLTGDGEGLSGEWSVDSAAFDMFSDLMLVFKSGNNTTLVGYLLDAASGTWTSPFENPPFDIRNTRDVSHISLYGRMKDAPPPEPVPEPATAAALGVLALGAFGALKKKA